MVSRRRTGAAVDHRQAGGQHRHARARRPAQARANADAADLTTLARALRAEVHDERSVGTCTIAGES
jgi:hypothetical protein